MGSSGSSNKISGKIKLANETLYTIDGRWDQEIFFKDRATGVSDQCTAMPEFVDSQFVLS